MTKEGAVSDLVSRLLTAIDETERLANAATPGPWRVDDERYAEAIYGGEVGCVVGGGRWAGESSVFDSTEDALHIVHNDPAAVLRRCQADRELIALHPQDAELGWLCQLCGGEGQNIDCTYPCDTLRLLAGSYGVD